MDNFTETTENIVSKEDSLDDDTGETSSIETIQEKDAGVIVK